MKRTILLSIFTLAFTLSYGSSNLVVETIKPPIKKGCKSGKHCYTNSNPYKMASFCKLVQMGNYKAVKRLISNGADINKKSMKLTPLMYAARHNRTAILKLLIEEGANLKVKSTNGFNALSWAKHSNATEAYQILKKALNS
jgi:hypothetical protein